MAIGSRRAMMLSSALAAPSRNTGKNSRPAALSLPVQRASQYLLNHEYVVTTITNQTFNPTAIIYDSLTATTRNTSTKSNQRCGTSHSSSAVLTLASPVMLTKSTQSRNAFTPQPPTSAHPPGPTSCSGFPPPTASQPVTIPVL
jgi:hypothetical protein